MHSSRHIILIILGILTLIASVWIGQGIATDKANTLLIFGLCLGTIICILLGQKIWILYLILVAINVPLIRGFSTPDLGQFLLVVFSVILFSMRKLKLHLTFTDMDLLRLLLVLLIAQVYIRNPVGLNILGTSSVGARPYFVAGLAFCAGAILSKYRVNPGEIKAAMNLSILGGFLVFPLNTLRFGFQWGGTQPINTTEVVASGGQKDVAARIGSLHSFSTHSISVLCSRISPLKASFHPLWAVFLLIIVGAAAYSGYRNTVAYVGFLILAGIAYRGGTAAMCMSFLLGGIVLIALAIINMNYPLPRNIQRSLSPLPGTWQTEYVEDAEGSTEWRVEMWKAALFTDDWIDNKIIGDGLGFTRAELERMMNFDNMGNWKGTSGLSLQQESMLIQGSYHSGPVECVRVVGYVGLVLIMGLLIRLAILTHKQIMRTKNTEWFPVTLFFGLPIIIYPFFFFFVFGTFKEAVAFIFLQSGILELIRNNLPLPHYVPSKGKIYRPLAWNTQEELNTTTSPNR